jgi:hypothetical protein
LPCAAAALAQTKGIASLVDPLELTSAKIDIASLQHALFVGVSRPDPACERQCQHREGDQRCAPAPANGARLTISMCVQDRRRFSDALGLGDNSHRIRAAVSTGCRSTGLRQSFAGSSSLGAHEHRWTATRPRPPSDAIGGKA